MGNKPSLHYHVTVKELPLWVVIHRVTAHCPVSSSVPQHLLWDTKGSQGTESVLALLCSGEQRMICL